jgi:hypothetical protein
MKQIRMNMCMSFRSLLLIIFNIFFLRREGWICDCINITHPATFDYGHPPIILVNIKPRSSKRSDEGYDPNPVRLRDLKTVIQVGPFEYAIKMFCILFLTFVTFFQAINYVR